jgi:hypothetical protein
MPTTRVTRYRIRFSFASERTNDYYGYLTNISIFLILESAAEWGGFDPDDLNLIYDIDGLSGWIGFENRISIFFTIHKEFIVDED